MRGSEELQVEGKGAWALTQEDAQHDTRLVRCLDPPPGGNRYKGRDRMDRQPRSIGPQAGPSPRAPHGLPGCEDRNSNTRFGPLGPSQKRAT